MLNPQEKEFFLQYGYLHVPGVLAGPFLEKIQGAFEEVWAADNKARANQLKLLKYPTFIALIEHPPILDRHRAIFGNQVQLLQYDLLRQETNATFPERSWHVDFSFSSDRPLSINTIVYLDEMTEERGPTRIVPGSHRRGHLPPPEMKDKPIEGEVAVHAKPGDAVFINSAIWHTGGRNRASGPRRGIYIYYGYWWMKRYESEHHLPWQALENASETRLRLLGVKMPDRDIHMYDPAK